jgi:hypothetical protein
MYKAEQPAPNGDQDDRHDTEDPGLLLRLPLYLRTRLPLHRRLLHLWVWVRVGALPR